MSGWPKAKIESLLATGAISILKDGNHGANYPRADEFVGEGLPFLTAKLLNEGRIDIAGAPRLSPEKAASFRFGFVKTGDVLLSHNATVGRVAIMPDYDGTAVIGTSLTQYRTNPEKLIPEFLAYYFCGTEFQNSLSFVMSQSTRNQVPITQQRQLWVRFPDLETQREIVSIVKPINDKIEVNRKASATLEEMARALYRSWFVDFDPVWARLEGRQPAHMDAATAALFPDSFDDDGLPVGWRAGKLSEVAVNPRNGVKPEQIHPDTPYIGLEHMPRRSITLPDWGTAADVGSQKSGMTAGDFLFGKLRPYFHKVGIAPVDGICSTDIIVVRPKAPEWAGFVLSVISTDEFVEHTNAGSSGTRMPRTNWSDMGSYDITLPTPKIATAFEQITRPWRERIISGVHEAKALGALRDTLLPRLMSGELRVGEARELVEEVA